MKFKKKKKNQMGYFYSMSPGNPKYNAEMFNHLMGSGDMPEAPSGSGGEACGESLIKEDLTNMYKLTKDTKYNLKVGDILVFPDNNMPFGTVTNLISSGRFNQGLSVTIYASDEYAKSHTLFSGRTFYAVPSSQLYGLLVQPSDTESLSEAKKKSKYVYVGDALINGDPHTSVHIETIT